MRSALSFVAPALAAAAFFLAPSARAEGFYITVTGGAGIVRTQGAAFDSKSQPSLQYGYGGAPRAVVPVHVEIDDWGTMANAVGLIGARTDVEVTIEFTKPNAAGVEKPYEVAKYSHARFTKVEGSYNAPSAIVEKLEFVYGGLAYSSPPPEGGSGRPSGASPASPHNVSDAVAASTVAPATLTRAMVPKPPPPPFMVFSGQVIAATSPPLNADVLALKFAALQAFDTAGNAMARSVPDVTLIKTVDHGTGALSQAQQSSKPIDSVTINFSGQSVDWLKRPQGHTFLVCSLTLSAALVKKDTVGFSGVSKETVEFAESHVKVANHMSGASGQL